MRATRDVKRGLELVLSVGKGPYPRDKRAFAYSVGSQIIRIRSAQKMFREALSEGAVSPAQVGDDDEDTDFAYAGVYADKAAELGLFSWASRASAYNNFDGEASRRSMRIDQLKGLWKHFWVAYADYRIQTGTQRPYATRCSKCNHKPRMKSLLKTCAGPCSFGNNTKPLYCNRASIELVRSVSKRFVGYLSQDLRVCLGLAIPQNFLQRSCRTCIIRSRASELWVISGRIT